MAQSPPKLKVVASVESPGTLSFLGEVLLRLASTGRVEPMLLICRDDVPDPAGNIPFWRVPERSERLPLGRYDWNDIIDYQRSLTDVEDYFVGRYLQAASSIIGETERWYLEHPVDCTLIWAGTRLGARASAAAARACGSAVVTLETAFFARVPESPPDDPGVELDRMRFHTLVWDTVQAPQCGPSQLTDAWRDYPIQPGLSGFIRDLQQSKQSKYTRRDIAHHLRATDADVAPEAALTKPPGTRALLVCGQLDWDSSVFFGDLLVRTRQQLVEEIASRLPEGWVMWFKAHPLDAPYLYRREAIEADLHARFPRCRCLDPHLNIHTAMQAADAVGCITSTVGLEATTYGKPVVTLGEAFYSRKGFTYDAHKLDDLADIISALPERMPRDREQLRDRFLSYILYQYLLPVGRPDRAVKRIEEAMERRESTTPAWTDESAAARAARLEEQIQAYVEAASRTESWFAQERELLIRQRELSEREREMSERERALAERELEAAQARMAEMEAYARSLETAAASLQAAADSMQAAADSCQAQVAEYQGEIRRITSRRLYRWGEALALGLRKLPGLGRRAT